MDKPDADPTKDVTHDGGTSSVELGKVKQALSIKMEKHDAHYANITPLGEGSFGEVHSARDTLLGREAAIKSLKKRFHNTDIVIDRFLKEARGTAQLEHPNIMPVHEVGMSDELGVYFTMKKIEGEDLKEILSKLQANASFYEKTYSLNFLLEVFLAVCNGVAFAHSKGVIHRDLKPANIMVGEFGEVLILDWGLVKQVGTEATPGGNVQLNMDGSDAGSQTMDGAISGTPNYMSPEQADGRIKDTDFRSDVYSLGAILYHILTYHPPFEKAPIRQLLENVKNGNFIPPRKRFPERRIPRELEAICLKAMSRHPMSRYHSVERLAEDIRNYIGNFDVGAYKAPRWVRFWKTCKRNPIKSSVVAAVLFALGLSYGTLRTMQHGSYRSDLRTADRYRAEGEEHADEAVKIFDELQQYSSGVMQREDTPVEARLRENLRKKLGDINAEFNIALSNYESVPAPFRAKEPIREGIYQIFKQRLELALYRGDIDLAADWLKEIDTRIDGWGLQLEPGPAEFLIHARARVDGQGSLEITGPDSVHGVIVWPMFDDEDTPRKIQGDVLERGKLPLRIGDIKKGSYVLQVTRDDGTLMPYPVYIGHSEQKQLVLEIPEIIPEGMIYVSSGEFLYGGEDSRFYREHQRSLPAFYIKKHEVTGAEYLEFWKSLSSPTLKFEYMSRIRYRLQERRYRDAWDGQGVLTDERLSLEYPVVGIPREAAEAFCEWKSRQTGAPIRLPTAEEWEKAARGVDGRRYVWGNGYEPDANLALTKENAKGKARYPLWAPPGKFSRDVSVYGVYDMAGNVREMTSTPLPNSDTFYQLKGGSASTPPNFLPCSYASDTPVVPSDVGFRYMQEIPAK